MGRNTTESHIFKCRCETLDLLGTDSKKVMMHIMYIYIERERLQKRMVPYLGVGLLFLKLPDAEFQKCAPAFMLEGLLKVYSLASGHKI